MTLVRRFAAWFDWRRRVSVLAIVGWVAVVVAAAGGRPEGAWVGAPDPQTLFTGLFLFVAVLGAVIALVALRQGDVRSLPPRKKRTLLSSIGTLVLVWLLIIAARELRLSGENAEAPSGGAAEVTLTPVEEPPGGIDTGGLLLLAAVVVAASGALWWSRRGRRDVTPVEGSVGPTQLEWMLDDALARLEESSDPREAILSAYVAFESTLARHGSPRAPAETPVEHVRRAISGRHVDADAISALADLYAQARFSDHVLRSEHREQAFSALTRARASLGAPTEAVET